MKFSGNFFSLSLKCDNCVKLNERTLKQSNFMDEYTSVCMLVIEKLPKICFMFVIA